MGECLGGYGVMGVYGGPSFTKETFPAPSVQWIMNNFPAAKDGYYWIDFDTIGPQFVYCILDTNINGGGWMGLNSNISPQISNTSTTSTWIKNTNSRLKSVNMDLLNVNIFETGCGGTSFYQLKSPSDWGVSYTQTMLLMERVSTIGQCSGITGGTASGYFDTQEYSGSFTSNGMCLWGDGTFANACCGAQNMAGLKPYWIMLGSGTNPNIRYQVSCAGGSGLHYHMWFVK
jgi:hypothetical protein